MASTQCASARLRTVAGRGLAGGGSRFFDDAGMRSLAGLSSARGAGSRARPLSVDEHPEALLEAERLVVGVLPCSCEAGGHGREPEGIESSTVGLVSMVSSFSLVVVGPAHVVVGGVGTGWRLSGQRLAVEPVLQDRLDDPVGEGADGEGTGQAASSRASAVPLAEADDAESGAEALLGMGPGRHDLVASSAVEGPVFSAQAMIGAGSTAWRRCDSGIWAGSVVWCQRRKLRRWEATRCARKKTSTVLAGDPDVDLLPTSW